MVDIKQKFFKIKLLRMMEINPFIIMLINSLIFHEKPFWHLTFATYVNGLWVFLLSLFT